MKRVIDNEVYVIGYEADCDYTPFNFLLTFGEKVDIDFELVTEMALEGPKIIYRLKLLKACKYDKELYKFLENLVLFNN